MLAPFWTPELEEAVKEYEKRFGQMYPTLYRHRGLTPDEMAADVRRRIRENDPEPIPDDLFNAWYLKRED